MAALAGSPLTVGVCGGIAAFKTAALVSKLAQAGAEVSVVMTDSACQFVGPATFAALSGRPVGRSMFDERLFPLGPHIELAQGRRLLCVAPATADFLGKLAHGLADDLLSTLALAFEGPILVAPAMNSQMWAKPSVQRNVEQLRTDGVQFVEPETGWLSCRQSGAGRMAEPEQILSSIERLLAAPA